MDSFISESSPLKSTSISKSRSLWKTNNIYIRCYLYLQLNLFYQTITCIQASTMWPKHSHLRVTFVKYEWKFCIDSLTVSWYFKNSFVPNCHLLFRQWNMYKVVVINITTVNVSWRVLSSKHFVLVCSLNVYIPVGNLAS
jgi:hypothetical protein